MQHSLLLLATATLAASLPTTVIAQNRTAPANIAMAPAAQFSKFTPNPTSQLKIDYSFYNDVLSNLVFLTGLPTRYIVSKPEAITGSRFIAQHTSPYRLEGNKIPFSKLTPEHIATLRDYKRELEDLGTSINIASLPKKEQLAYWFNLHNVSVILQIAEHYPVVQPSKLKIGPDNALFHDAKIITIHDTQLSLRDIRENIVYPNWSDAKVIYGFFLGDIGSPTLQGQAFSAANVEQLLNQNADEFVNSLRSFSRGGVSKIYKDVERFYFPNFEQDLRDHFQLYMWDDVFKELSAKKTLKINAYEYDIADMEGGHAPQVVGNVTANGQPIKDSQSFAIASYTNQIVEKTKILEKQGKIKRGVVTVGDNEDANAETEEKAKEAEKPMENENNKKLF